MSMLQEYMASALGSKVGKYHQVSNNYHAYLNVLEKISEPEGPGPCLYDLGTVTPYKMVNTNVGSWSIDLLNFMDSPLQDPSGYEDTFFIDVARPMAVAWAAHKKTMYATAIEAAGWIQANDWRFACHQWLVRRMNSYEAARIEAGRSRNKVSHD